MNKFFLAGKWLGFVFLVVSHANPATAQCCASGGSCPIAGGASAGVLLEHQVELNANYQYVSTRKFLNGNADTTNFLDRYWSKYAYFRLIYGVTKDLTLSVESGYYFNKTQKGIDSQDEFGTQYKGEINTSKGFSDLIIFPRYDIINRSTVDKRIEVTLGLGVKIPIGTYNDSTNTGQINFETKQPVYFIAPPAVQPTNGANDFIFYAFFFRGFPQKNFRVFASSIYIKKGTNPLGEQFGDYASFSLFAGKTLFKNVGITLQVKGEWIDKMKQINNIDLQALYSVDVEATGSKKVFFVPQLSYSYKSFTLFTSSEFPLYQYVNKVQIASQYFITTGISYKFMPFKKKVASGLYFCPMHPERTGTSPAKCPDCGMDLELKR